MFPWTFGCSWPLDLPVKYMLSTTFYLRKLQIHIKRRFSNGAIKDTQHLHHENDTKQTLVQFLWCDCIVSTWHPRNCMKLSFGVGFVMKFSCQGVKCEGGLHQKFFFLTGIKIPPTWKRLSVDLPPAFPSSTVLLPDSPFAMMDTDRYTYMMKY